LDPFLYSLFLAWTKGEENPYEIAVKLVEDSFYKGKLVENVVGIHLARYFPEIAYWRNKGEIDFICFGKEGIQYVEVKYKERIREEDKKEIKKVKGGIIISKSKLEYDYENNIAVVPAHLFLSTLS